MDPRQALGARPAPASARVPRARVYCQGCTEVPPKEKCPQCLSLWGPLGDTPK